MDIYEKLIDDRKVLNDFLDEWPIERIETISLEEYVGVDNKETFVQWVENKTRSLGSINGLNSKKFGIYKRKDLSKKPTQGVYSGEAYTWQRYYGDCNYDVEAVFEKVRANLVHLVKSSIHLDFKEVNNIQGFYNNFKWKVAFLYSNENLIPVFTRTYLTKFAYPDGIPPSKGDNYLLWHQLLFDRKPPVLSVYNFMRKLFYEDGYYNKKKNELQHSHSNKHNPKKRIRERKASSELKKGAYTRTAIGEVVVHQPHSELQEKLYKFLKRQYPNAKVLYEKNFIDVLLISDSEKHYYEVKTADSAEVCIKQGLGQLMSYYYYELSEGLIENRKVKICVFGRRQASSYDAKFIAYIKSKINIDFEYLCLEMIES